MSLVSCYNQYMTIMLSIPKNAHLTKKKSELITFSESLYDVPKTSSVIVNLVDKLKIKPEQIFQFLQKVIGENVQKGDVLAKKKGLLSTQKATSPETGIIREVRHTTGEIVIQTASTKNSTLQKSTLRLSGTIANVGDEYVEIEIANAQSYDVKKATQDCASSLFYFEDEGLYFTVDADKLRQSIVVIETLKSHIAAKCEALGVVGFICCKDADNSVDLPTATISQDDYKKLITHQKSHGVFSTIASKLLVYDVK